MTPRTAARILLRFYPQAFRREFATDVDQFVRSLERSGQSRRALICALFLDAAVAIPREWRHEIGSAIATRPGQARVRPM